jgi:hypothetical protein
MPRRFPRTFLRISNSRAIRPCLDGFAPTHVIGNKQIHAWQSQRLPQWLELIGIEPDTRTERELHEAGVGRRDTIPTKCIEIGGEVLRQVESTLSNPCPLLTVRTAASNSRSYSTSSSCPCASSSMHESSRASNPAVVGEGQGPQPSTVSGGRGRSDRLLGQRKSHSFQVSRSTKISRSVGACRAITRVPNGESPSYNRQRCGC